MRPIAILSRSASAATLPSGAVGLWYMDTYSAANSRPLVANSATAVPVSANIFSAPRRLFNRTFVWSKSNVVVVDDAVAGSDGVVDASTATGTGNWLLYPADGSYTLTAGTYTVAISAKRNTATDQTFCFTKDFVSTTSPVKTATSVWQDFSYTFTLSSASNVNNILLCSNASANADLQIRDFRLFAGSSDLGVSTPAGHIYFGNSGADTRTAYASGEVDMTAGALNYAQFASDVTLTSGFTAQAMIRKTSSTTGYDSFLAKISNFAEWTGWVGQSNFPVSYKNVNSFNDTTGTGGSHSPGLWNLLNDGLHLITSRHTGTVHEVFLDDVLMFTDVDTLSATVVRDLFVNGLVDVGNHGGLKYRGMALWNRSLSTAEVLQSYRHWQARAALSGAALDGDTTNRILVADGDSITIESVGSGSFVFQYGANASPPVLGTNFAKGGSSIANLVTRAPYIDAVIPTAKNGRKFLLSVLTGANDLSTYTGATDAIAATNYLAALAVYHDARRTAGFKTIANTILPISGNTAHNARRALVNATIVSSWVGVHCDAVSDLASDAIMGGDTSFTVNPTYWYDGTHPNSAGHTRLEVIFRAAANAL